MMEVQGVGKTKCEYCVSERFKDVHPIDTNVRTLHLNQAGHKLRMYSLHKTQLKFEAYLKYVESNYGRNLLVRFHIGVLPLN